jgi:hypothetical protein
MQYVPKNDDQDSELPYLMKKIEDGFRNPLGMLLVTSRERHEENSSEFKEEC